MDKRTYNRMVAANFYSRPQQPIPSPNDEVVRHDLVRYVKITSPKTAPGLITALQRLAYPFRVLEGIDGTGNYYVEYPNWNPNDPARIDYHAQLMGMLPYGITVDRPVSTLTLSYRKCLNVSSVHNLDPPLDMFRHTDSKIYIEYPDTTTTPNTKMTAQDVEDYMGRKGIRLGPVLRSLP